MINKLTSLYIEDINMHLHYNGDGLYFNVKRSTGEEYVENTRGRYNSVYVSQYEESKDSIYVRIRTTDNENTIIIVINKEYGVEIILNNNITRTRLSKPVITITKKIY